MLSHRGCENETELNTHTHTLEAKRLQIRFMMMLMLNGADAADDNADNGYGDVVDVDWG